MRASAALFVFAMLAAAAVVIARPDSQDDLYVPTPIGYMLRSCVHRVPNGARISHERDSNGERTGRVIVRSASGSMIRTVPKCDTSRGPMLRDEVRAKPGTERQLLQFPPDYDGWLAYTAFNYPAGLDSFLGNFNVPATPVETPDVMYLFTGLQNIDWIPLHDPLPTGPFDIIQPVLQYPGDNGNYWSVKSWYVTLDVGYLVSAEIQLNPGDSVFGNMTRVDPAGWYIGSTAPGGLTTSIVAEATDRLTVQPWAYNTLECYGCTDCGSYPVHSPELFTNLQLFAGATTVTPTWLVTPKAPNQLFCHEKAVVSSPAAVTINFGNE